MTDPNKELLADLLFRWEELRERGQDTPASELAKDRPELIAELGRRIEALKTVSWLDKPFDGDPPGDCPSASPSHSSRTLANRYRLDALIAEGGFAQVHRAYDVELQRTVAIKIPKPSKLESREAFQAEARRVARLKHDNIVPVYDVGLEGDTCFIVTEYVEGGSLADRLVEGNPSRVDAIRWVCEIADALEYAHVNGVIHLDVKPANILIEAHGRAKLADFGIARSAMKTGEFAPSLGTLRYMSPEQLEGKPADHRSDIYSLGVVLYEVLTGRIPYSSTESNVLRKEIVRGPTQARWNGIPAGLRSACEQALARRPHERQRSAAALAAELRRAGTKRNRARLVGALALASALGAGWLMIPVPRPAPYAGQRRHWEGTNGVCFVHDPDGNQWQEQDEHGEAFFWFKEHARTTEYIELLDESRDLLIRLYDDRVAVKSNAEKARWSVMRDGKWLPKQEN